MSEKSKINRKKRREHEEKRGKERYQVHFHCPYYSWFIKYGFILFCINEWLRNRKKVYCEQGKSI